MNPSRDNALVDLLDRILVKGIIIHADIIITVADIPLIGINLRAAIAGIKTMLDYGIMEAWDEKIRRIALEGDIPNLKLEPGEEIIYRTHASLRMEGRTASNWMHGYIYLTSKRFIIDRRRPGEVPLELLVEHLCNARLIMTNYQGRAMKTLQITNRSSIGNEVHIKIVSTDVKTLMAMLRGQMNKFTAPDIKAN